MTGLQYTSLALKHWKRWKPKMVREMRKDGTLNEEVQRASREASDQVARLMQSGMQKHEAEEMVLPDLILLKPEPGVE